MRTFALSLALLAGLTTSAGAVTITYSDVIPANDGALNGSVSNCYNCDVAPVSSYGVWDPTQAGIFDHSVLNYAQAPLNGGTYYSVYNDLVLHLNTATTAISFVWGSPSYDNVFSIDNTVIHGDQVFNAFPDKSVLVTITGLAPTKIAEWSESFIDPITHQPGPQFAFEWNDVVPHYATATPELSTWAMFGFGLAAMGFMGLRSKKDRLATI